MARLYYEAVRDGHRTLESVPKRWRVEVERLLSVAGR